MRGGVNLLVFSEIYYSSNSMFYCLYSHMILKYIIYKTKLSLTYFWHMKIIVQAKCIYNWTNPPLEGLNFWSENFISCSSVLRALMYGLCMACLVQSQILQGRTKSRYCLLPCFRELHGENFQTQFWNQPVSNKAILGKRDVMIDGKT